MTEINGKSITETTEVNDLDRPLPIEQEKDLESMRFSLVNAGMSSTVVTIAVQKLRHIANFQSLDDHHFRVACLLMMQIIVRSNLLMIADRISGIPLDVGVEVPKTMDLQNLPPIPAISKNRTLMTEGDRQRMAAAEAKRARKAKARLGK
jgi:hypothetical protein